ncbi:MAG: hypothetical protein NC181_03145 [Clostridium sp.]|nr:hypothetical protein [Clostridium sp.]MCM1444232.1 hypothetical protein [Candidatus Amulumruptor caecigallinarius]
MKSRMDKYYQTTPGVSRSNRNKDLYNEKYNGDYDFESYSNVEGVAQIDKNNKIDLDKLQELLKKREIERMNDAPHLVNRNVKQRDFEEVTDDRSYDINQVLTQARTEKNNDNKTRALNNTCYDILKSLDIKDVQDESRKLQELVDTIATTKALDKLNNNELSLDMLNDLKSDNGTEIMNPIDMKADIKEQSKSYKNSEMGEIDNSFYTTSLGLKKEDFEDLKDIQESIITNNKLIKILVSILIIVLIAGLIFLFAI